MSKKVFSIVLFAVLLFNLTFASQMERTNELKTEDPEQQMVFATEDNGKVDRFIVKYKTDKKISKEDKKADKQQKKEEKQAAKQSKKENKKIKGIKATVETVEGEEFATIELEKKVEVSEIEGNFSEIVDMSQVEYIQPDYELTISTATEAEAILDFSEATEEIIDVDAFDIDANLTAAHEHSTGEDSVIAIIDTAIDLTHDDYKNQITDEYDFVKNTNEFEETLDNTHGTHIAGIITKVAPSARIMPLKVFEAGRAYTSDIIRAISYAEEKGATIVNCSFGSSDENQALAEAIEQSNMMFICAAGNNRTNVDETPIYPACYPFSNVISVAAINNDGGMSYFSNYGENVDIAAWGREIESSAPNNEQGKMNGTSMSAAFVSGAVALSDAETVLASADRISSLTNKVNNSRKLNFYNSVAGITPTDVTEIDFENDFDVLGYEPTIAESWELFSASPTKKIVAGAAHVLVLKEDGTVWAWGDNTYGQLGDGTTVSRNVPKQVIGLTGVTDVEAGRWHSVAVRNGNTVYSWGENSSGQLGDGSLNNKQLPAYINDYFDINCVIANDISTYVLNEGYQINVTGFYDDYFPSLYGWGGGFLSFSPFYTAIYDDTVDLSFFESNLYCLTSNGEIWSSYYDFIYSNHSQFSLTEAIVGFNKIAKNYAVDYDGFVYKNEGNIWKLANSLQNIKDIESSANSSAAIDTSGNVFTWGKNDKGQLGDRTTVDKNEPVQINIANVKQIACGEDFMVALREDGSIWTWGNNDKGQLGDGTNVSVLEPKSISQTVVEEDNLMNWEFENANEINSWVQMNHVSQKTAVDGQMYIQSAGIDPYLHNDNVNFAASDVDYIEVRIKKNVLNSGVRFFWRNSTAGFSSAMSEGVIYNPASINEWQTVKIYVKNNPNWTGQIRNLRFDPATKAGDIYVDYIRLKKEVEGTYDIWEFNGTNEGFGTNSMTNVKIENGYFKARSTTADPTMSKHGLSIPANLIKYIEVSMQTQMPNTGIQVFWATNIEPANSASKSITNTVEPGLNHQIYRFDVSQVASWTGTVTSLRIDPISTIGDFSIDYIRLVTEDNDYVKLTQAYENLDIVYGEEQNENNVKTSLTLKTEVSDVSVAWTSSDACILNDGTVTRPTYEEGDKTVTLTATLTCGNATRTKKFNVIVKHEETETEILHAWEFETDFEGFIPNTQISNARVENGKILATSIGTDPYFTKSGLSIDASKVDFIEVSMKNNTNNGGVQMFWLGANTGYSEANSVKTSISMNDSEYKIYRMSVKDIPGWTGTIHTLRFDPVRGMGDFGVEYVRLLGKKNTNVEVPITISKEFMLFTIKAKALATSDKKFILEYDTNALEIVDLVAQTYDKEVSVGLYGDIQILHATPGKVIFKKTIPIQQGQKWNGVLNIFKFKTNMSFEGNVSITIAEYVGGTYEE